MSWHECSSDAEIYNKETLNLKWKLNWGQKSKNIIYFCPIIVKSSPWIDKNKINCAIIFKLEIIGAKPAVSFSKNSVQTFAKNKISSIDWKIVYILMTLTYWFVKHNYSKYHFF